MRKIPIKLRNLLERMPRMKMCEIYGQCEGPIQWHHTFIYGGKQISEQWAILGVCKRHHDMVKTERHIREALERRSLEIATDEELSKYPNKNWVQLKKYLNG